MLSLPQNSQTGSGANPVSGLIGTGDIATGAWSWLHTCIQCQGEEWVGCTSTPPIYLHSLCADSCSRHLSISTIAIIIPSAINAARNWQWFSWLRSYPTLWNATSISELRRTRRSLRPAVCLSVLFYFRFVLQSHLHQIPTVRICEYISFVLHARPTLPCSMLPV